MLDSRFKALTKTSDHPNAFDDVRERGAFSASTSFSQITAISQLHGAHSSLLVAGGCVRASCLLENVLAPVSGRNHVADVDGRTGTVNCSDGLENEGFISSTRSLVAATSVADLDPF